MNKRQCCKKRDGSIIAAINMGAGIYKCPKSTIQVPCGGSISEKLDPVDILLNRKYLLIYLINKSIYS